MNWKADDRALVKWSQDDFWYPATIHRLTANGCTFASTTATKNGRSRIMSWRSTLMPGTECTANGKKRAMARLSGKSCGETRGGDLRPLRRWGQGSGRPSAWFVSRADTSVGQFGGSACRLLRSPDARVVQRYACWLPASSEPALAWLCNLRYSCRIDEIPVSVPIRAFERTRLLTSCSVLRAE